MPDCLSEAQKFLVTILYRSGRSIDQAGLYQECVGDPNSTYFFMNFAADKTGINNRAFLGLCVPNACDSDTVKGAVDWVLQKAGLGIHVFSISEPSKYSYPMGGLFWFTAIWLGLLALAVLAATVIKMFNKKTHKIIDCFALQDSLKIFAARESSLKFFNGIKGLCLFWIILGHSFSIRVIDSENWVSLDYQFLKFINLVPLGAFFAVDVFFLLGGFLLGYVFLSSLKKNTYHIYLMGILHRLLRFYPSYITAMLIWYQIFPQTGSGPFWPLQQYYVDFCNTMWRNILFIDNLFINISCMPWAWYLSNDVQLFVLCIGLLYIYTRWPKIALILSASMIVASITFNFVVSQMKGYFVIAHVYDLFKWNDYFMQMYIKPWSRAPPYILGLFLGIEYYKFFKYNSNKKEGILTEDETPPLLEKLKAFYLQKPLFRYMNYAFGLGLMFTLIFLPRNLQVGNHWPQVGHSFYLAFSKILFVVGITMVMLPATVGIQDFVTFLCDTQFFSIIGKISFWAYLIHYMVVMRSSYNLKYTVYFTPLQTYQRYVTDLILSLVLAFVFTMVVEAPFVKLEKLLLRGGGAAKKREVDTSSTVGGTKDTVISTSNATG